LGRSKEEQKGDNLYFFQRLPERSTSSLREAILTADIKAARQHLHCSVQPSRQAGEKCGRSGGKGRWERSPISTRMIDMKECIRLAMYVIQRSLLPPASRQVT